MLAAVVDAIREGTLQVVGSLESVPDDLIVAAKFKEVVMEGLAREGARVAAEKDRVLMDMVDEGQKDAMRQKAVERENDALKLRIQRMAEEIEGLQQAKRELEEGCAVFESGIGDMRRELEKAIEERDVAIQESADLRVIEVMEKKWRILT